MKRAFSGERVGCARDAPRCIAAKASRWSKTLEAGPVDRRQLLTSIMLASGVAATAWWPSPAHAERVEFNDNRICPESCAANIERIPLESLPSGLTYRDIKKGRGPNPEKGYQVVVHYVAMTQEGAIFENSVARGQPFDLRVGAGQLLPGLDEAILTMQAGGVRRAYVPSSLSFKKNLKAAPGRPSVVAGTPIIIDIELIYTPGLEDLAEDADILQLQ